MTLRENQAKFIMMEAQLILKAITYGTPIVRLEWMRSLETQRAYVARGVSKTLNSDHLKGLASDFCFLEDIKDDGVINMPVEKYKQLGEFWESLHPQNEWGGRFGETNGQGNGWDAGHFAYKGV